MLIALNCNERCHDVLDTRNTDFKILYPEMKEGVMKIFKSPSHAHSGVSCVCDSDFQVALKIVSLSTQRECGKILCERDLFTHVFDVLFQSEFPCVQDCGGCRLDHSFGELSLGQIKMF